MPVNQLKAGVVLNYVVIILNTVVGLLYTPYMLRMMGQSEYGLYSLVASVIAYLTVLDLGFGNAIVRYTAKFRAEKKTEEQYEMFGMFFLLYLVIGIIAFGIGLGLYFNVGTLFGDTMTAVELDRARIMMLLLVANLAFTFPMSIWGSIIQAYEDFVFQKSLNIFRIILNTAVMICLLHFGYKAVAMVVVQTIFNVLTLVVNFIYCRRKLNIHIYFRFKHFHWGFLKEVAIYSFWIFLNAIMDRVYWSTGQFVLGAIVGTAAVAVFAIAIQLEGMYMQFSTAISSVFLPKVTAMVATNRSRKEISDLFIRTGRIQYIVLAYILSGFIIFGRQFIELWAGAGYSDAYIISLLFFIPLTVPLIQNLGITILQARNEMKFRSVLYIIIALVSLAMQIVLTRYFGGIGCAMGVSGALVVGQILIMNVYYQRRQDLDIKTFWKEISKMSIIPIVLIFSAMLVIRHFFALDSWGKLILGIAAFSLVYIPLFFRFSMTDDERNLFISMFHKIFGRS
ncbi:MAG: oligosaccharide flippase family protein [Candidatus Cryptobacteroides sp.]|nr:oligosaccharide flippase family protein [Candidatus Cryptobacteroides sp.]